MSAATETAVAPTECHGDGCPSCGTAIRRDANYCGECRYVLRTRCFRCGGRVAASGHIRCKGRRR